MKHVIHSVATATALSISGLMASSGPAQAYQVDCAILLCLAGGWPASAPCAHARAVFILHSADHAMADRAALTNLAVSDGCVAQRSQSDVAYGTPL